MRIACMLFTAHVLLTLFARISNCFNFENIQFVPSLNSKTANILKGEGTCSRNVTTAFAILHASLFDFHYTFSCFIIDQLPVCLKVTATSL